MKKKPIEEKGAEARADGGERRPREKAADEKEVFLRTVYPLNAGLPHYVDVPGSW